MRRVLVMLLLMLAGLAGAAYWWLDQPLALDAPALDLSIDSVACSERTDMHMLMLIAALGLAQEPPLQIPPPAAEAPAPAPAPPPAQAPAPASKAVPAALAAPAAAPPTAPLSFYSETFPFAWDRVIALGLELDGLKVSSIFFNNRELKSGWLKDANFGTRAQVEVTNASKQDRIPGFAVAVFDKEGRLLGVASGGTKLGVVKPGETETFDLNFTQVKERLPRVKSSSWPSNSGPSSLPARGSGRGVRRA